MHGPYGVGKKTVAQGICKELVIALLAVDIAYLINKEVDFEDVCSRIFREAVLQDSALYVEHFDRLFSEGAKNSSHKNILFNSKIHGSFLRHRKLLFSISNEDFERRLHMLKRFIRDLFLNFISIGNFLPIVLGDKIGSDCKEDKRP